MRISKIIRRLLHLVYFLLPSLAVLFFGFSSSAYADVVSTVDLRQGDQYNKRWCDTDSDCADYKYIIFESLNPSGDGYLGNSNFCYFNNKNTFIQVSALTEMYVFDLENYMTLCPSRFSYPYFTSSGSPSDLAFRITFTNDLPTGGIVPTGTFTTTENGTFDISSYQFVSVDVPPEPGDYDDELNGIKNAIFIGAGTLLVIYFFYMIYGALIRSSKR